MMRVLLRSLSPPGASARLSILIFHRVLAAPDPLFPHEVDAERFSRICAWVRRWFNVLPLDLACQRLRDRSLPARALAITFDDGYADNHDIALPILRQHGLSATFFVATGFLDGGRMWNDTLVEAVRLTRSDQLNVESAGLAGLERLPVRSFAERREAIRGLIKACRYLPVEQRERATQAIAAAAGTQLPTNLMMRSSQVQAMVAQGMLLGGHTVSHPILTRLPRAQARSEMQMGKDRLEALTQVPIKLFAYPNGKPEEDFSADHVQLAQEIGFEAAVTTAWGTSQSDSNRFKLPRFTPWDRSKWAFGLRMARNFGKPQRGARSV